MKARLFLPLGAVAVLVSSVANAGGPDSREICDPMGEHCYEVPTQTAALAALQKLRELGVEGPQAEHHYVMIGAAAGLAGGLTYVGGRMKRAAYQQEAAVAAKAAEEIAAKALKVKGAIVNALAGPLEAAGAEVAAENAKRVALKKVALNADEMIAITRKHLVYLINQQSIRAKLGSQLGDLSETFYQALMQEDGKLFEVIKKMRASSGMFKAGGNLARTAGINLAETLGAQYAKGIASQLLKSTLVATLAEIGTGVSATCAKTIAKYPFFAAHPELAANIIGAVVLVGGILIDPISEGGRQDTMESFYIDHPEALVQLDPEQAKGFLLREPRIGSALVKTLDVLQKMKEQPGGDGALQLASSCIRASDATGSLNNAMDHCPSDQTP